ncbi:MAG TPA: hypothetical protein VIH60_14275 [Steroidobacteraceae bacterium]
MQVAVQELAIEPKSLSAEALAQREPVTGIKELGIENVLHKCRDKLDTQRIKPNNQR